MLPLPPADFLQREGVEGQDLRKGVEGQDLVKICEEAWAAKRGGARCGGYDAAMGMNRCWSVSVWSACMREGVRGRFARRVGGKYRAQQRVKLRVKARQDIPVIRISAPLPQSIGSTLRSFSDMHGWR